MRVAGERAVASSSRVAGEHWLTARWRRAGARFPSASSGPVTVAQDGPYDWFVPTTPAQVVSLGAATPAHMHIFNGALGVVADLAGNMPYSHNGAPAFGTVESGWDLPGIAFDGVTVEQCLYAAAGLGPDLGTDDYAHFVMMRVKPTDTAASKHYLLYGVADPDTNQVTVYAPTDGTDRFTFRSENVNVSGSFDNEPSDVALLVVRRAGFTCVYTSTGDRIVGTYAGTLTDGYKCIGAVPVAAGSPLPATFTVFADYWWTGADVPQSDAEAKTLFERYNVDPLWSVPSDGPTATRRFYPTTAAHFATLAAWQLKTLGRAGRVAEHGWGFQELVTPIADQIATGGALDLSVVFGTMNAAISITGYARKCVSWTGGGSKGQATFASGSGPNPLTDDFTIAFSYTTIVATTAFRQVMCLGGGTTSDEVSLNINTIANGSELQAKATTDVTDDAAAFVAATPMRIYARWIASTKTLTIFTRDRKFSVVASGTVADGPIGVGGHIQTTPAFKVDCGHMHRVALSDQAVRDEYTTVERAAPGWAA